MTTPNPSELPAIANRLAHLGNRSAEILLLTIFDRMPAAVYVCDRDGLITFYNAQAAAAWGRAPKQNDSLDRY